jgi:deoxyribodipyrimidine photo-lyase
MPIPDIRRLLCNQRPIRADGRFVVYWMTAARRTGWSFGLEYAVGRAVELRRPLVVVETLVSDEQWTSRRHHAFVIQGMIDNAARLADRAVRYYPYVESDSGLASRLMTAMAAESCLVVTDDFPIRSFVRATDALARESPVCVEKVDSNGLLPMRAADRVFPVAHGFRRFLQKNLRDHLLAVPAADPLKGVSLPVASIPQAILRRWPATRVGEVKGWCESSPLPLAGEGLGVRGELEKRSPFASDVPIADISGGSVAGRAMLDGFLRRKLAHYAKSRNHPDDDGTSRLSAYLHFGHISVHEILDALALRERWTPGQVSEEVTGKAEGWWRMSPSAEAFLDELVTWREIGFNFCSRRDDYDQYASLPDWARATLARHARDPRPNVYTLAEFDAGRTHDPLWNAAQMQLVREGRIHNYLRMLWGKKILHWSESPQQALKTMIELNNKYALDGQDPCSYSGIFWTLGRYDRAWGPERPVFGTIRYMTSESAARKLRVQAYQRKYAPERSERGVR